MVELLEDKVGKHHQLIYHEVNGPPESGVWNTHMPMVSLPPPKQLGQILRVNVPHFATSPPKKGQSVLGSSNPVPGTIC